MLRIIAFFVTTLFYLRLPLPGFLIFFTERILWRRPEVLPKFLSRVHPSALWAIADRKLIILVERFFTRTPALQDIQKKFFPSSRIRRVSEFKRYVPILDKDSYHHAYPLEAICQGGVLPHAGSFYKSAGTSGRPTLWVESIQEELEFEAAVAFIGGAMIDTRSNDYVILNCWALGSWPTGVNFFTGARFQGKVVNVGTNLKEALDVLRALGPKYRYLLAGYPPFLYHLVQECKKEGIILSKYTADIVSGGEGFVEEWRDSLIEVFGRSSVIFSVYGSTDKGLGEGLETNFAYAVRSLIYIASTMLYDRNEAEHSMALRFGRATLPFDEAGAREFLLSFLKEERNIQRVPMVFQFNPMVFYNESHFVLDPVQKREINEFLTTILSPESTIPRVRYNIHDEGRVMRYQDVMSVLHRHKILLSDFNPRKDRYIDMKLPFLLLFGRSDGTISVDGANIFPEDIEECLRLDERLFASLSSFQLFVSDDYRVGIALELKEGEETGDEMRRGAEAIFKRELERLSLGYGELVRDNLPSRELVIEVYRFGEGPFANRNIKLRYVRA